MKARSRHLGPCVLKSALPLVNLPKENHTSHERGFAWLVVLPIIIGASLLVVGGANLAVNIYNRVSPPTPANKVTASSRAHADDNDQTVDADVPLPGSTLVPAAAYGNKGSYAHVRTKAAASEADKEISLQLTSSGYGVAGPNGDASGHSQGFINGALKVDRDVPISKGTMSMALSAEEQENALLTFQPAFDITKFHVGAVDQGGGLTADIDIALPGTGNIYHWGFTTELSPTGLQITDRRGSFSDTDITIDGTSILDMKPAAASFIVPIGIPIDFAVSEEIGAAESRSGQPVPEPSAWLLLASGLGGLPLLRRTYPHRPTGHLRQYSERLCTPKFGRELRAPWRIQTAARGTVQNVAQFP